MSTMITMTVTRILNYVVQLFPSSRLASPANVLDSYSLPMIAPRCYSTNLHASIAGIEARDCPLQRVATKRPKSP